MTQETGERLSGTRLAAGLLLSLTPVPLTSLFFDLISAREWLAPLSPGVTWQHASLTVYAVANWLALAAVLAVVRPRRLRALGFRLQFDRARIVGGVLGFAAGVAIYVATATVVTAAGIEPVRGMDFRPSVAGTALLAFSAVLTAPVCEELFFRVLWVGGLINHAPAAVAGVASICLFAGIHFPYFGPGGVAFIVFWSAVPVALFLRFRDITAPLLMHVLNNAYAYVALPLLGVQ